MDDYQQAPFVKISEDKAISKSDLLSLLKTYNCYHEGKSFQLRNREEEGELIVEGLLNISWGLRRPIRLQMHDDNERVHFSCTGPWRLDQTGLNSQMDWDDGNEKAAQTVQKENTLESNNNSVNNEIFSQNLTNLDSEMTNTEEETPQLMRTKSDASFMNVQRRSKYRTSGEMQRIKRHRFSINGHFYNHKVENTSDEFALYLVHETGERTKLRDTEYPLISRILHGPCEKIAKIFLMETDLGEEVTYDVAQYIKFEMPLLDSFVEKLKEEEEREITKLTRKYSALRSMIQQQLEDIAENDDHF